MRIKVRFLPPYFAVFFFSLAPLASQAAQLDDLYTPLIQPGRVLTKTDISYFSMIEEGVHGSASFGKFESEPDYLSFGETVKFSPINLLEVKLGYGKDFNADYERLTYNPAGSISFVNHYDLNFLHRFSFGLRKRFNNSEVFLDSYGNQGKSSWNSAPGFVEPDFFTTIRSHYEDIKIGWRFITKEGQEGKSASNLSMLTGSLLDPGQASIESAVQYKNGKVRRHNKFYGTSPATLRSYTHNLRASVIPKVLLRYGIFENAEVTTGLAYGLPHRFQFEFQQYNFNGTTNFIVANYKVDKKVDVPLRLAFRPRDNLHVKLSFDTVFGEQILNGYEKELNNTITTFDDKELKYVQTQPTVEIAYLLNPREEQTSEEINRYTKKLLKQKQLLANFKYFRDITHLRKNGSNAAANILDAETIFYYPLDNFVAGTEHSSFLAGNSTLNTPDVHPQNYHQAEIALYYGFWDSFNAGIGVGFRSRSGVHQFTFADLASRQYQFEPYKFFDFYADWQLSTNSLLSFKLHYVPKHKTLLKTDIHPKVFEVTTEYARSELAYHFLF